MGYIPEKGDVVWINLDPQTGHEQAGFRPVLVLSPAAYNEKVGLMLCCPITNQVKGYPFEVQIRDNPKVSGEDRGLPLKIDITKMKGNPQRKITVP